MQEFGAEVGQGFVNVRPNIRSSPRKAQIRSSWDGICYKWFKAETSILVYCFKYWFYWYRNSERFKKIVIIIDHEDCDSQSIINGRESGTGYLR